MNTPLTEITPDNTAPLHLIDLVDRAAGAAIALALGAADTSTLVARHRLSDEEPAPDEDDPAVDADDNDDEEDDWEDDEEEEEVVVVADDDDDDDDDWDDDEDEDDWDDDDEDEPANRVAFMTPMAVGS